MLKNFHTHTWMCKHAQGRPCDYVKAALAVSNESDRFSALGFSDHCPFPFDTENNWIHVKMSMKQIDEYIADVKEAKRLAPFPVYLGFECEWDSEFSSWYTDELKDYYGAQYLILGSHWFTDKKGNHIYIPDAPNYKDLSIYIKQTIDGMRSGNFDILAHPDLPMKGWKFWNNELKAAFSDLIDAAIDCDILLEINGEGMNRPLYKTSQGARYQYPYYEFWELVKEKEAKVTVNADAHSPETLVSNLKQAQGFASLFNFSIEELY